MIKFKKKKEPEEGKAICPRCFSTDVDCAREVRLYDTVYRHECFNPECTYKYVEEQQYPKDKGPDSCPLTHTETKKIRFRKIRLRKVRPQDDKLWEQHYPQQEI